MKWISAVSQENSFDKAIGNCHAALSSSLREWGNPDLAIAFASLPPSEFIDSAAQTLYDSIRPTVLIGCSASGVIGTEVEIENKPALSLICGWIPKVKIIPFQLSDADLPDLEAPPSTWHQLISISPEDKPSFVILSDPLTIHVDHFLSALDYAFPESTIIGGLVSGGQLPGENSLFLNHQIVRHGLVGIALSGDLVIDPIVAQGCRPIGTTLTVTDCHENILNSLNHRSPLQILEDLYPSLSKRDHSLLQTSLFIGVGMNSLHDTYVQGDFLIRNIMGLDAKTGSLSLGTHLRPGQTVQFHLRDAQTSREDLRIGLENYRAERPTNEAKGALLFSCLGRGSYLYGQSNHDIDLFQKHVGKMPVGGFFCNGEIGPVGGTTYLHGYTSCFGIIRPLG